jgi:hypothetical protein
MCGIAVLIITILMSNDYLSKGIFKTETTSDSTIFFIV